jgi:integrase
VQETWYAARDEQPSRCRCGRLWSARILWCQAQRCSVPAQPGGSTLHPLFHDNQRHAFQRAGLASRPRTGSHLFRHTAASHMLNHGVSFKEVADVLGHRSLQTTGIYAKLELDALAAVALPWLGGAPCTRIS